MGTFLHFIYFKGKFTNEMHFIKIILKVECFSMEVVKT